MGNKLVGGREDSLFELDPPICVSGTHAILFLTRGVIGD